MLVACRLAGLSALEGGMQASTDVRNAGEGASVGSRPFHRGPCESYSDVILRIAAQK